MSAITPFLWFENQAEEAAHYYIGIFPDAKLGEVRRFPAGSRGPEGSVMTASFTLGGQQLVALNGNPRFAFSPAMSLLYMCASSAEAERVAGQLAEGGERQPGGWLRDKYGVSWQVHASS
ncbi:MAG TPA: VOC family protein [Steroidobacteraceae bacterium]|nr:VOC family protein [Steroidobacteraceae bacterium]